MPSMKPTLSVDIKRVQGTTGGLEDDPTIVYSGVLCLELYPIDPHIKKALSVAPMETILQTITYDAVTLYPNDTVSISGVGEYPVIAVENWFARVTDTTYVVITVKDPA